MVSNFQNILWKQFGAAIDMLANAIKHCPEEYLKNGSKQFYIAYHTILFLDYYLTIPPTEFVSQLPFTIMPQEKIPEESIDDIMPDRIYTKTELLDYLQSAKDKCRRLLANLSEENFEERWITEPDDLAAPLTMNYSVLEILLYNLRHVQHHAAQLNLILRRDSKTVPDWVSQADEDLQ